MAEDRPHRTGKVCRLGPGRSVAEMITPTAWQVAARRLTTALRLSVAPVAITFTNRPEAAPPFADPAQPMPDRAPDGRTGRVPAGCVFWVHALERTFSTLPEDHGNCSV